MAKGNYNIKGVNYNFDSSNGEVKPKVWYENFMTYETIETKVRNPIFKVI